MYLETVHSSIDSISPQVIDDHIGLEETALGLCAAIAKETLFGGNREISSIDLIYQILGVIPQHRQMVDFLLHVLENNDSISLREGGLISFTENFTKILGPEFYLNKIHTLHPRFSYFFTFVLQCSKKYPDVFKGRIPGASVIFPDGTTSKLENLYKNTPQIGLEQAYLRAVRDLFVKWGKTDSVLEIGAGQGVLTDILYPVLGYKINQYVFSDISKTFVKQAQTKYTKPQLSFREIDCSKSLVDQNCSESFDIIVGFNVIHATPNILQSIRELNKALNPNGKMIFIENMKQEFWIDMIYGLVDGWWTFDDGRKDSPLLSSEKWCELLDSSEFRGKFQVVCESKRPGISSETGMVVIEGVV